MSVLLFGANGQVGHRLKTLLGDACTALTREACDLAQLNEKQARALIEAHEPSIIVNAAAYTAVDAAENDEAAAVHINAHAPGMLARAAGHVPFIHLSTDYVFDGKSGPYREGDATNPVNRYGFSKLRGEQEVLNAGGSAYVFRLQWVYDSRGKNFFLTMQRLMAEQSVLRVVADQFGAPTPAHAVARALAQTLLLIRNDSMEPGIYHLASSGHTSWHGFACAIAQAMRNRATVAIQPLVTPEYPTPAARAADTRLDCSKLARHGIVLPHWRAALHELLEETDAHH